MSKTMKYLMGKPALFLLIFCYCELSNLWFYTLDYLFQLGEPTSAWADWGVVIIQPWLIWGQWGQWVTQCLKLPSPYNSVQTSLITGIVSAILLSICFLIIVKIFPRMLRISVILFLFLTVVGGVSYALDSYRLNVYLSTSHDDGGP